MKKTMLLLFLSALICVLLSSCGIPEPPGKEEIPMDLPSELTTVVIENPFDETNADVYEMNITGVAIERRQTNEKEDTVYCRVGLENEFYRITKYVTLDYTYYDEGGWILDGYSEYSPAEWDVLDAPFNEDDVSSVLDYNVTGVASVEKLFPRGEIVYTFPIEEIHNNGRYTGDVSVVCEFDGQGWTLEQHTDDVEFVWDLIGTWIYKKEEETSYAHSVQEIVVTIEDFNQTSLSMKGSWYMHSEYSFIRSHSEDMLLLEDNEQVGITAGTKNTMIDICDNPDKITMHSYIHFYPDEVEACYATHFQEVKLERQTTTAQMNNAYPSGEKQPQELSEVVDRYFEIVKSGIEDKSVKKILLNYESFESALEDESAEEVLLRNESATEQSLKEEFPNYYINDELFPVFAEAVCRGLADNFSYEIVTANQYSMDQTDARRMWATAIEEEFHESALADPDAYAEVLVRLSFYTQDKTDIVIGFYDFLLVQDNGKWGVYFVDFIEDESPRMLFPF